MTNVIFKYNSDVFCILQYEVLLLNKYYDRGWVDPPLVINIVIDE